MLSPRGATDLCGARCVPRTELQSTGWAVSGQAPDQGGGGGQTQAVGCARKSGRTEAVSAAATPNPQEAGLSVQGRGLEQRAGRSLG